MTARSLIAIAVLFAAGVYGAPPRTGRLKVVTSFAPIYCFTKNVVGDLADVAMLLPPGSHPHDFALSPRDLKRITGVDVAVFNGLGIDAWMLKAVRASARSDVAFIDSTSDIAKKARDSNPHTWLDPVLAIEQVRAIADGLARCDPANAATYEKNAAAYIDRLRKLDQDILAFTASMENRRIVTSHNAFDYFAARYGFEVVGVYHPVEGLEPGARHLGRLRKAIRDRQAGLLFAEPSAPERTLQSFASDMGLALVYMSALESGEASADFYIDGMRKNLEALHATQQR